MPKTKTVPVNREALRAILVKMVQNEKNHCQCCHSASFVRRQLLEQLFEIDHEYSADREKALFGLAFDSDKDLAMTLVNCKTEKQFWQRAVR